MSDTDINLARRSLGSLYMKCNSKEDLNKSIKIVESHSAPDILTTAESYVKSGASDGKTSVGDEEEICNHELSTNKDEVVKKIGPSLLKTLKNSLCTKSPKSFKKNSKYQNLISPIASYIHDSPSVPLIRNVRPPLTGVSKHHLVKENIEKVNNEISNAKKIYASLPPVAYRTAKETHLIRHLPSKLKLPKSQWAQRVVSANPKPVVVQHCYRLKDSKTKPHVPLDDSTNELFWNQADLSICTQRPAVKKL